jgi:predicted Zn finger-like uncharacterized protein
MLTCCPQCGTTFRVSPQQLKVHQGEVRCGRCSAVFDAFDSLLAEPDTTQESIDIALGAAAESSAGQPAVPVLEENDADARAEAAAQARKRELRELLPQAGFAPMSTAAPTATPAFSGSPRPRAHWIWLVFSLIAALALLLQITYRYRSAIAESWPDSRPYLDRACAELHCVVSWPRHLSQVSIDAFALEVDTTHSNLMLLTATLKNRASFSQEYPTLELTLTDPEDQPLARRVFTPADYLERKTDARAGFPANAELPVKVYLDSREVKATGYGLVLFYP